MHLIYPSADLEQFNERNARHVNINGVAKEDLIVMYTGNFQPWQGLGILFESMPLVISEVPKVKFVIVGGRKNEINKEKENVKEFTDKVIFVERQPYELMPSYMSKADILVLPRPDSPVNWGTGKKMGEYLAMGKAVVAIEVKISNEVRKKDIKGLLAFCEEHPNSNPIVVSQDRRPRRLIVNDNLAIRVLPWDSFLIQLWNGDII